MNGQEIANFCQTTTGNEEQQMSRLSHLDELEAEAIYIIREVAAECEKPVMLNLQRYYETVKIIKGGRQKDEKRRKYGKSRIVRRRSHW